MAEFFEAWVVWTSNWLGIEDLEYAGAGPVVAIVSIILGLVAFFYLFRLAARPFIPLFRGETLADYGRLQEPKPKRMRERHIDRPAEAVFGLPAPTMNGHTQADRVASTPTVRILPLDDFVRGDGVDRIIARDLAAGLHTTLARIPSLKTQKACLSSPPEQACKAAGHSSLFIVAGSVKKLAEGARVTLCVKEAASGERIWTRNVDMSVDDVAELAQEYAIEIGGAVIMRQGSAKSLVQRTSSRAVTRQSSSTYPSDHPRETEPQRTFDQPAA